jgi:hypothetical protein
MKSQPTIEIIMYEKEGMKWYVLQLGLGAWFEIGSPSLHLSTIDHRLGRLLTSLREFGFEPHVFRKPRNTGCST